MKIPFVDLSAQYLSIKEEIDREILSVLESTKYIKGSHVEKFEKEFAEYAGAKHCIGVGNGTDAIFLALRALGIGPGDEVITVPNTFIATTEAISLAGGKIVWSDIDYETYLMDASKVESLITEKTKAILPVHLYGNVAELEPLRKIADKHNLCLVSDAAQAHGAKYNGRDVNYYSDISTYSFYPGKNLGAYGDAGAVVTDDDTLAKRIRMLADHGRSDKYVHQFEGINSRLDTIQAAILSVKLKYLDTWIDKRRKVATEYNRLLAHNELIRVPFVHDWIRHVYHLYVVQVVERDRDQLLECAKSAGISMGVHYPVPLHKQPAYENGYTSFPEIERIATRLLSLPLYPEIEPNMLLRVVESLVEA